MRPRSGFLAILAAVLILAALPGCAPDERLEGRAYIEDIERFRAEREERLRSEEGWLTLVGLFWLQPGENRLGTDPSNAIVFPQGTAPPVAGSIFYDHGSVRLVADPAAEIRLDGEPVAELDLHGAEEGSRVLHLGRLRFYVIERGGRHGIRVKDTGSPVRTEFAGLDHYPIDPAYRVRATLTPHDPPREIEVATAIGTPSRFLVPGRLEFELKGKMLSLEPLISTPSDTELFIIFKDATSGRETYGAGRYLYATLTGGKAELDFNRAYNPPCAFTPFATCPLPPPGNRLDVRIEAGERGYGSGH